MDHTESKTQTAKILGWVLSLAIVIVLNVFFAVAIHLVYPENKYEAFCPVNRIIEPLETKEACIKSGGEWSVNTQPRPQKLGTGETYPLGYCDADHKCRTEYESAQSLYNRNVFVALVILGLISLLAGYMVGVSSAVTLGLSLGGLVSLIVATIRYWSDMSEYLRLVILAIALIALIWFGIKKFRD